VARDLDEEILAEFLVESAEGLDQLDRDLLALEHDPANHDAIASAFRTIHTIKGTCGFLGFVRLESITHAGENLLSRLRDGELRVDADIADALLALTDAVRAVLDRIEHAGDEGGADYGDLVATLERLTAGTPAEAPGAQAEAAGAAPGRPDDEAEGDEAERDAPRFGETIVSQGLASDADVALGLIQQEQGDPRHLGEILVEQGVIEPPEVRRALEQQAEQRSGNVADATIRVDVGLLDDLMNLVGELVLTRNQIMQWGASHGDSVFAGAVQRLNLITTDLQARMMKTRMQPIGNVWGKFPRVVRDLAAKCAKKVTVQMDGRDTELDKSVIEAIRDPLTHLVRNAVDHGIESPQERIRRGKPDTGVLTLRAFHEGGKVNIEIADDGAGIDVERVKALAVERGISSRSAVDALGEREVIDLIFRPGFSTAESVTAVSGRGVGMDVVKTNIEAIGGSIEVHTRAGEGTAFRIKIPLTLAIIPALVVTTAGDEFAIPQVNLLELVRLEPGGDARIESVQGVPVYRLRGEILPIVSLRDELHLGSDAAPSPTEDGTAINIVVLRAEDRQFGLIVDEINDTEEIVVKPLAAQLDGIDVFSGCTIMGDGRVALILDVHGLAQRAGLLVEQAESRRVDAEAGDEEPEVDTEPHLVVRIGDRARASVALATVDRLEELDTSTIEWSAGREVVQYRGGIMTLVRAANVLGLPAGPPTATLPVVAFEHEGRSFGLVVDEVVDIVTGPKQPAGDGVRSAVTLGTAVLDGAVTDILDLPALVKAARASGARTEAHA
jgi:two-component system chemotaxis sensor kinase CheA